MTTLPSFPYKKQAEYLEIERIELVDRINSQLNQICRNQEGQYATPADLAADMVMFAKSLIPKGDKIRFLEPGFGTGSFYSALLRYFPEYRIECAVGFEKDPRYGHPAKLLWSETALELVIDDFTKATPPDDRFNLVICNPPYVRHHHLNKEEKVRLKGVAENAARMHLSGLAGLYCYFLGIAHPWMAEGGLGMWLIPSEFMDVNYGDAVKQYLLGEVTLLRIHRFDPNDVQFADALVSSAIVCFRNNKPPKNHQVEFTFGGTLAEPQVRKFVRNTVLQEEAKWTRFPLFSERFKSDGYKLGDFFNIKRGIATGDNKFFILTKDQINEWGLPDKFFRPILPSPKCLKADVIESDKYGNPIVEKPLFLLDVQIPEEVIRDSYPKLAQYLEEGHLQSVSSRYLCCHRNPWYSQENRPPAPIVCTYIGRIDNPKQKPFRFIRNRSQATATNTYLLLYPKPELAYQIASNPSMADTIWQILCQLPIESLLGEGRVYGGGMHKLEPRELANVPAEEIAKLMFFDRE